MLQHVSFLRLPLDYATFYFSVLLLVDTWVVFVFWVMLDLFCGCSCCEHCCAVCALSRFVLSDSLRLHGLQPARLVCPWWFSRQEYWSGLPCPPPGDLLNPGMEHASLTSPALAGGFFTTRATYEAHLYHIKSWHKCHPKFSRNPLELSANNTLTVDLSSAFS